MAPSFVCETIWSGSGDAHLDFAEIKDYIRSVIFQDIITVISAPLQFLLPVAFACSEMNITAGCCEATTSQSTVPEVADDGSAAALPVRASIAVAPHIFRGVPRGRYSGDFHVRFITRTGDVPRFLASSLRFSFLRHSVLLL